MASNVLSLSYKFGFQSPLTKSKQCCVFGGKDKRDACWKGCSIPLCRKSVQCSMFLTNPSTFICLIFLFTLAFLSFQSLNQKVSYGLCLCERVTMWLSFELNTGYISFDFTPFPVSGLPLMEQGMVKRNVTQNSSKRHKDVFLPVVVFLYNNICSFS